MINKINTLNDYFSVIRHVEILKKIKTKNIIFLVLNIILVLSLIIFFISGGVIAYNTIQYHCYKIVVMNFAIMLINLISIVLSGSLICTNIKQIKRATKQIKYYSKLLKKEKAYGRFVN